MRETDALKEADRIITICNACRYCEGLCAVFPAMETKRAFAAGDLTYLANLCHNCGACYFDCQFSPPHEFDVNLPRTLARLRADSYRHYAWPGFLGRFLEHNGLWLSVLTALSVAAFILGFVAWNGGAALLAAQSGPGAFYRLMPHRVMAALFGAAFLYALFAMAMSFRAFWRDSGAKPATAAPSASLWQAIKDAASLRYLDGGGDGCRNEDDLAKDRRKHYHHAVMYGFLLCFASTSIATLYHYAGREAPYPWYDLPVVLGTLGGAGLVIGGLGLLFAKGRRDPAMIDQPRQGMDVAFILMLTLTGLTGLLLLFFRAAPAMGALLALHLGVVFSLFLTMPYSKFVHGLYRLGALLRYASDRRSAAIVE